MKANTGKATSLALACALGCGAMTGGAAAFLLAPASDTGELGLVQTAQAKSKAAKAKAAYKKFLSGTKYQWEQFDRAPGSQDPATYAFVCANIDGDGSPELFVENNATYYAAGFSHVYTYYKGKVKLAGGFSVPPTKVYKKGHVLYYWDMHTGSHWGGYYKLNSKGKLVRKAGWGGTELKIDAPRYIRKANGIYYTSYKIGSKSVSYKKYCSYMKRLVKAKRMPKEDMIHSSMKCHANMAGNRAKYL